MLGKFIKEKAKERGYSLAEIERALNLGRGSLSNWNNHEPSFTKVIQVAEFLDIPIKKIVAELQKGAKKR